MSLIKRRTVNKFSKVTDVTSSLFHSAAGGTAAYSIYMAPEVGTLEIAESALGLAAEWFAILQGLNQIVQGVARIFKADIDEKDKKAKKLHEFDFRIAKSRGIFEMALGVYLMGGLEIAKSASLFTPQLSCVFIRFAANSFFELLTALHDWTIVKSNVDDFKELGALHPEIQRIKKKWKHYTEEEILQIRKNEAMEGLIKASSAVLGALTACAGWGTLAFCSANPLVGMSFLAFSGLCYAVKIMTPLFFRVPAPTGKNAVADRDTSAPSEGLGLLPKIIT